MENIKQLSDFIGSEIVSRKSIPRTKLLADILDEKTQKHHTTTDFSRQSYNQAL
jgi:hypothetical protein